MSESVRDALARADVRYARRAGYDEPLTAEHLDALAAAVRGYVNQADPTEASTTIARQHGQIASLEQERDQLAEQLADLRADLERRQKAAAGAAEQIAAAMRAKVEELRVELAAARARQPDPPPPPPHKHTYVWETPDQPPRPCDCGQPYPRTVLAEHLAAGQLVQPDREPFDVLMGRIRGELSTWGDPASTTKLKGVA